MNRRKILSGLYGLAVVIIGIWLENHGRKLASQIVVMTAIALLGPVGLVALVCCALFHIVLLWSFRGSMPFRGLGTAIILGVIESLGLALASAKVFDVYGQRA